MKIDVWICNHHVFDMKMKAETYAKRTFKRNGKVLAIEEGVAFLKADMYPHRYGSEHPKFPLSDWQYETVNDYTRLGYADWVDAKLEEESQCA